VLYQYGLALFDEGDVEHAQTAWRSALDSFERISARQWVSRIERRLSGEATGRYL
jgi:cytochrome c-type biogenesis protein CcmH/NrfG